MDSQIYDQLKIWPLSEWLLENFTAAPFYQRLVQGAD
jgi:hypothetical protein